MSKKSLFLAALAAISLSVETSPIYADCQPVTVSIINLENHPIRLLHAGNDVVVPANSSGRYDVIPKSFYTKNCSSLSLITDDETQTQTPPTAHVALLHDEQNIAVRVDADGTIESNLDEGNSFNVEKLIPYHGLEPYLS